MADLISSSDGVQRAIDVGDAVLVVLPKPHLKHRLESVFRLVGIVDLLHIVATFFDDLIELVVYDDPKQNKSEKNYQINQHSELT